MTPAEQQSAEARDAVIDLAGKFGWLPVHDGIALALPYVLCLLAIEDGKLDPPPEVTKMLDSLHRGHVFLAEYLKQSTPKSVIQLTWK